MTQIVKTTGSIGCIPLGSLMERFLECNKGLFLFVYNTLDGLFAFVFFPLCELGTYYYLKGSKRIHRSYVL